MIACTIAGSDSGGGAGIQADLKTFQELGVFGTSALTALTAQNTLGVHAILPIEPDFVQAQLRAIFDDFDVKAIKTGMLHDGVTIHAVASVLKQQQIPLIVDPVMVAKGGATLLQEQAVKVLKEELLPLAMICTPNIPEAEILTEMTIDTEEKMDQAAQKLLALGVRYVILKGGHLDEQQATDRIYWHNGRYEVSTPRIKTKDTHGTGCTFSAALTAFIANGKPIQEAVFEAKKFTQLAIAHPLGIGHGHGPTNHFAYHRHRGLCEVLGDE